MLKPLAVVVLLLQLRAIDKTYRIRGGIASDLLMGGDIADNFQCVTYGKRIINKTLLFMMPIFM